MLKKAFAICTLIVCSFIALPATEQDIPSSETERCYDQDDQNGILVCNEDKDDQQDDQNGILVCNEDKDDQQDDQNGILVCDEDKDDQQDDQNGILVCTKDGDKEEGTSSILFCTICEEDEETLLACKNC